MLVCAHEWSVRGVNSSSGTSGGTDERASPMLVIRERRQRKDRIRLGCEQQESTAAANVSKADAPHLRGPLGWHERRGSPFLLNGPSLMRPLQRDTDQSAILALLNRQRPLDRPPRTRPPSASLPLSHEPSGQRDPSWHEATPQ